MPSLDIQSAISLLEQGRPAEAIPLLEKLTDVLPVYATAYVLLARAYEADGQWQPALGAWQRAQALVPNSPSIREGIGRVLTRLSSAPRQASASVPPPQPAAGPPEAPREEARPAPDPPAAPPPAKSDADPPPPRTAPAANRPAPPAAPPPDDAAPAEEPPEPSSGDPAGVEDEAQDTPPKAQRPASSRQEEDAVPPRWKSEPMVPPQEEDDFVDLTDAPAPPPVRPIGLGSAARSTPPRPASAPPAPEERSKERQPAPSRSRGSAWSERKSRPEPEEAAPRKSAAPAERRNLPTTPPGGADDLERLISELESARIIPRPDVDQIPAPDLDDEIDDMVSETLARIYASQHQYDEAARVYDKLAQQQPDRADEFEQKAAEMRQRVK